MKNQIIKFFIVLFSMVLFSPFTVLATDTNMILQEPKFFDDSGMISVNPNDEDFNINPYNNDSHINNYNPEENQENEHNEYYKIQTNEIHNSFIFNLLKVLKTIFTTFIFYIMCPIIVILLIFALISDKIFGTNIITINLNEIEKLKEKK